MKQAGTVTASELPSVHTGLAAEPAKDRGALTHGQKADRTHEWYQLVQTLASGEAM
jgi:hypothetical protein